MPDARPSSEMREPHTERPESLQFEVEATRQPVRARVWARITGIWHASGILSGPLTIRQKLWRGAALALTLALVAAVIFGQQIGTLAANAWTAAFPRPQAALPTCLVDGAWSPSGSRLAILGYEGACGKSGHLAGVLSIYDGAGRLRLRRIALDPLLSPAEKTLARAVNTDRIELGQIIWFRGEQRLAITFTLPPRSDIGETTTQFGILLLDPAAQSPLPQVYFYEIPNQPGGSYPLPDTGVIWNLKSGQGLMFSGAASFEFWNNPLPLAYQYGWTGAGDLVSHVSIAAGGQIAHAIGNPQGDATFQIWQSGWLTSLQQSGLPDVVVDARVVWHTTFAAASPDGEYVLAPLHIQAPVSARLAGTAPQEPGADYKPPILLSRDPAFSQIVNAVAVNVGRANRPIVLVAWRPDGKAVATFNLNGDQKVNIYDCATGRLLKSLAEPHQPAQFTGVLSALRWSPDGRHLLLLDGAVLTV